MKYKIETETAKKLVAAIITQAVDDYKYFVSAGCILDGVNIMPKRDGLAKKSKSKRVNGMDAKGATIAELLEFFKRGKTMDTWISLACLDINPNQIRSKLGIAC
jgi:hypothetical protein